MTRRLLAVLVAGALAAAPAALHAQLSTSFGIAGGLAAPMGDLKDIADAGYNIAGHVNLGAPLIPVGVRLEVGYNSFNYKSNVISDGSVRVLSGTANATLALGPTGASPYLIGGVGVYNTKAKIGNSTSDGETKGGVNIGGGFRFPLGLISTFVEARYHVVMGDPNLSYIPITFGINF